MKFLFTRIVALLLVPCLIAEPALAIRVSISPGEARSERRARQGTRLLDDQALEQYLESARFGGPLLSPKAGARGMIAIAAVALVLIGADRAPAQRGDRTSVAGPQTPGPSQAKKSLSRQFVEDVLRSNGGVPDYVQAHPEVQAAIARMPGLEEPIAESHILFMHFRNGGFSGVRISNRGHALESYLQRLVEPLIKQENRYRQFLWEPPIFAKNVLERFAVRFSLLHPGDVQKIQAIFDHSAGQASVTPIGADILLGSNLLNSGICTQVRLVERASDHKLLLHVWFDNQHDMFILLGERWGEFDVQKVGKIKDPGFASILEYDWAKLMLKKPSAFWITVGKVVHAAAVQRIVDYFLDLRFFRPLAMVLDPLLFSRDGAIFYGLPHVQQQQLFNLAGLHAFLEIQHTGSLRTAYPKRAIEMMESPEAITMSNLEVKVKEFQLEMGNVAQELNGALVGTENLEAFANSQATPFQFRYGSLFVDLREILPILVKLSGDRQAALREFSEYLRDGEMRDSVREKLKIGGIHRPTGRDSGIVSVQNPSPESVMRSAMDYIRAELGGFAVDGPVLVHQFPAFGPHIKRLELLALYLSGEKKNSYFGPEIDRYPGEVLAALLGGGVKANAQIQGMGGLSWSMTDLAHTLHDRAPKPNLRSGDPSAAIEVFRRYYGFADIYPYSHAAFLRLNENPQDRSWMIDGGNRFMEALSHLAHQFPSKGLMDKKQHAEMESYEALLETAKPGTLAHLRSLANGDAVPLPLAVHTLEMLLDPESIYYRDSDFSPARITQACGALASAIIDLPPDQKEAIAIQITLLDAYHVLDRWTSYPDKNSPAQLAHRPLLAWLRAAFGESLTAALQHLHATRDLFRAGRLHRNA